MRRILLILFLANVLFFVSIESQMGCDMDILVKQSRPCSRGFLDRMLNNPNANCSEEYHKMKTCLHDVIFKQCLQGVAEQVPWLKPKLEQVFDIYLSSISSMESAACHENITVNVSRIDPSIKRLVPCNQALYDEVPLCSVDLVAKFNVNRTDPKLCSVYSKAKKCEAKLVKKYCNSRMHNIVDPYNPFCKKEVKSNFAPRQTPAMMTNFVAALVVFVFKHCSICN